MTRSNKTRAEEGARDRSGDYSLGAASEDGRSGMPSAPPISGAADRAAGPAPRRITVPVGLAGERLDKVLAKVFPEFSRSRLQGWIEARRVTVDGAPAKVRQAVPLDAVIELVPDLLPEQLAFAPEPVPLAVVYEDDTLVVIDKPAGLVVHPAAGNWSGTLLNGLLHRYGAAAAGLPRAGIVHRLDKETSGLMVVARTLEAQTDLVRQLQARTVKRHYLALVWGRLAEQGTIDAPIGRDPRERTRMAVVSGAAGKPARTHYRRLAGALWEGQPVSALGCDLETGRTHQIRVHCAHIGHPLLGDPVYGRIRGQRSVTPLPGGFARQALHAERLGLIHPRTRRPMQWHAAAPADLAALIDALGLDLTAAPQDADEADYALDDEAGRNVNDEAGDYDPSGMLEDDDEDAIT